ncbi:beta-hydroxylase [Myxococcaceae bacterium]|nr:beta-hydroxylase [Myxococcaceae bacterium]
MIRKGSLAYSVISLPGLFLIRLFERLIVATTGNATFFPADAAWIRELEANWRVIRAELDALLDREREIPEFKDVSEEQARITRGVWRTHILYVYGRRIATNCGRCPDTDRLLRVIPGMKTAMFSILAPATSLAPHRGPFKGVLRYHLALVVPSDPTSCAIRVGKEVRHWIEGQSLVFDDTHDHEAWNRSDRLRAVLFVDFVRPLPFPLGVLNRAMIALLSASPFIRNITTQLDGRVNDIDGT